MDKKRLQEYLELIKKLLSCSTDEEINQIESLSKEEIQACLQFLVEVLQATDESKGDAQVVYPLCQSLYFSCHSSWAEVG